VIVERVDVNYMMIKDGSQLEFDITPKKEIIFWEVLEKNQLILK
jgi:hypothetical protein